MECIEINLLKKELCLMCAKVIGRQGEANVKSIKFILPDDFKAWSAFVDIKNAKGEEYRKEATLTESDAISVDYKFDARDLREKGNLLLDLVLINEKKIIKPFSGEFLINEAICAERVISGDDSDAPSSGIGGIVVETDPTVPDWAKSPNKPNYTAEEVGALPANTIIPSKAEIVADVLNALETAEGGLY